ncbi:MAG: family 78 glycoside hydrolase catalytic domain, partial [Victivallales bacterium]|nr:family 78 glycoside hydrolase catalytic domain [Victivallales bacterium]
DDSKWTEPVVRAKTLDGFWKTLEPRPVPPLLLKERVSTRIVMQGRLFREREFDTFADTVANDFLTHFPLNRFFDGVEQEFPAPYPELDGKGDANWMFQPPEPLANGCFLVVDLGSEYVGLIDIELSASSGTVIDISHGEHLLDGKVRNKIGDRNFTDRYVCKDGVNRYVLPFRRIGGRYLQLNITKMDCSISIKYVGIRPLEAPRPPAGDFISGDRVADLTHEVGVRTLELCMHEHYEDCPWREQALYAYDSRNQALYGYYVWGNYKFAKASLDLLGKGVRSDGFLEICAPAKSIRTIPIFSFVWVSEINEYWLHSGDDSLFREFDSQMEFMIGARLKNCDRRNGLYTFGDDDGLWHFYEWAPGLSVVDVEKDEHHAPYNLYFIEMLESYSAMLRRAGRTAEAEKYLAIAIELKEAVHKSFWDSNKRCYASKMINGELTEYHDHIQFLAIYNDIVPEEKRGELLTKISSRSLESLTLSAMPYMLRSMMKISSDAREYAAKVVFSVFSKMILAGATSLWETQEGPDAFGGAGSLCHAWSSLPVYYHLAYVLGVRPIEPGFRTFAVSPYSNGFGAVKGSIPTPSGMIDVEWTRNDDGLRLEMSGPENLTPILEELPDSPICSANYNNTPMK